MHNIGKILSNVKVEGKFQINSPTIFYSLKGALISLIM